MAGTIQDTLALKVGEYAQLRFDAGDDICIVDSALVSSPFCNETLVAKSHCIAIYLDQGTDVNRVRIFTTDPLSRPFRIILLDWTDDPRGRAVMGYIDYSLMRGIIEISDYRVSLARAHIPETFSPETVLMIGIKFAKNYPPVMINSVLLNHTDTQVKETCDQIKTFKFDKHATRINASSSLLARTKARRNERRTTQPSLTRTVMRPKTVDLGQLMANADSIESSPRYPFPIDENEEVLSMAEQFENPMKVRLTQEAVQKIDEIRRRVGKRPLTKGEKEAMVENWHNEASNSLSIQPNRGQLLSRITQNRPTLTRTGSRGRRRPALSQRELTEREQRQREACALLTPIDSSTGAIRKTNQFARELSRRSSVNSVTELPTESIVVPPNCPEQKSVDKSKAKVTKVGGNVWNLQELFHETEPVAKCGDCTHWVSHEAYCEHVAKVMENVSITDDRDEGLDNASDDHSVARALINEGQTNFVVHELAGGTVFGPRASLPTVQNFTTPTEFPCEVCDVIFATENALNKHKGRHVRPTTPTEFVCEICDVIFATERALNKHKNRHVRLTTPKSEKKQ